MESQHPHRTPPRSYAGPSTRTSGLAIAALVTGLLGLALPAVICGHIAQSKIKKSGGALGGGGLAVAGLILGYIGMAVLLILVVLSVMAFPAYSRIAERAMETKARGDSMSLKIALATYMLEYEKFPFPEGKNAETSAIRSNHELMDVLLGAGSAAGPEGLNPRGIAFYEGVEARPRPGGGMIGGVIFDEEGGGELVDPWGNPYYLLMDTNADNQITIPDGGYPQPGKTLQESILIWSSGRDGIPGTEDDVLGWGGF